MSNEMICKLESYSLFIILFTFVKRKKNWATSYFASWKVFDNQNMFVCLITYLVSYHLCDYNVPFTLKIEHNISLSKGLFSRVTVVLITTTPITMDLPLKAFIHYVTFYIDLG